VGPKSGGEQNRQGRRKRNKLVHESLRPELEAKVEAQHGPKVGEIGFQIPVLEFRLLVLVTKQEPVLPALTDQVGNIGAQQPADLGVAEACVGMGQQLPTVSKIKAIAQPEQGAGVALGIASLADGRAVQREAGPIVEGNVAGPEVLVPQAQIELGGGAPELGRDGPGERVIVRSGG
jgi:hypothetical protein